MANLSEADWSVLETLADEVIPADDFPSASEAGFREYLTQNWDDVIGADHDRLARLLADRTLADHPWFVNAVAESFYADPGNGGNYGGASFFMIDFEYAPEMEIPHELPHYERPALDALEPHYDAIVIGSGAGGGVMARKLCEAGLAVLCVERGQYLNRADVPMDHLRNHRYSRYGHNVGPELEGNPRVIVSAGGRVLTRQPHQPGWSNVAMGVGGGTRVWGAQAWRFAPEDFRMASTYGVPEGSSLADWPFTYDELAPHYDWAEYAIGVAGEPGHRNHGPRSRPFPMPPGKSNRSGALLKEAAGTLGWATAAPPLAINSRDYDGRGPCANSGLCVGFSCPMNARGGSQNTMLPKAMATGRFTLLTDSLVSRILPDTAQRVRGVELLDRSGASRQITADVVVSSAGAVESARLLAVSGYGNHSDQLGRHLQSHVYTGARGDFEEPVANEKGPGPTIATCEFNHGNPGLVGGGMIANDFPIIPVLFWVQHRHRAPAPWGLANKQWMRDAYHHTQTVMGPTQEIPNPEARVTLDTEVVDWAGIPVARLSGGLHPETLRTGRFMRERAEEWLRAAGGRNLEVFGAETAAFTPGGQHQAGTCRMGSDPAFSVTDPFGRVHETENLYVADASLHVTNGGFNPALTVMAVASRIADGIVDH